MPATTSTRPVALTIAGSDSGGGAGIQADLRTFTRLGAFGTCAITAVTAQNLQGVSDVAGLPADSVRAQVRAVAAGFTLRAVKTGMLWCADTVQAVAELVADGTLPPPVVDPVMVATSGDRLLEADAVAAYESTLFPRSRLITPNLDEAALLLGVSMSREGLEDAARELHRRHGVAVLLKGGHVAGDPVDLLCTSDGVRAFHNPRVPGVNTHGSGCTLSAAIAAKLALGMALEDACEAAIGFLHRALRDPAVLEGEVSLIGIENSR